MSDELIKGLDIILGAAAKKLYDQVADLAEAPCAKCARLYPVAMLRPMLLVDSMAEDQLELGLCCEKCRSLTK